jgi:hypothetical protein
MWSAARLVDEATRCCSLRDESVLRLDDPARGVVRKRVMKKGSTPVNSVGSNEKE